MSQLERNWPGVDAAPDAAHAAAGHGAELTLPDNDLTRSLDPQFAPSYCARYCCDCLRHRARSTPMLLVLEDAHWIDPLSQDLLEFIARNLVDLPVLLVGALPAARGRPYGPMPALMRNWPTHSESG